MKFMRLCVYVCVCACVLLFTASCQQYLLFFVVVSRLNYKLSFSEDYSLFVHLRLCVCVYMLHI